MPTYEYKCRECGHRFEVVQSFTAEPLKKCGECGGELGKVFGNIGITFKGSGFYRTDSRSSTAGPKSSNGKDKSESKTSTDSSSGSSSGDSKSGNSKSGDSKPAKSESKSDSGKTSTATKDKSST